MFFILNFSFKSLRKWKMLVPLDQLYQQLLLMPKISNKIIYLIPVYTQSFDFLSFIDLSFSFSTAVQVHLNR